MTKKKARTRRPALQEPFKHVQAKEVPKTKAQLVEEIERLNGAIRQRDTVMLFVLFLLGYLANQSEKRESPVTAIVKAKS